MRQKYPSLRSAAVFFTIFLATNPPITLGVLSQGHISAVGFSTNQGPDGKDWDKISAKKHKVDRITFFGQPTKEEIEAFARAGGKVVISARTQGEMNNLGFDEKALVESLGMEYVNIPTSGETFGYGLRDQFIKTMDQSEGPVLFHCKSGSRAAGIYALSLIKEKGMDVDEAIAKAKSLGMGRGMVPLIKRALKEAEPVEDEGESASNKGASPVKIQTKMEVVERVIAAVDPQAIRQTIDQLAGFGTRHTLSDTDSDTQGIGAARRWVKAQFQSNIAGSGKTGDETPRVYFDPHTVEPDGRRIIEPVEVVNVIYEIPGSSPKARDRLYYVLAHLDSRASEANDTISDAPGANDDGSGVAALIELARVLSKEHLESTIILMVTSGEEQGLYGARLHAQQALAEGRDIRAVLNNDTIGDPSGVLPDQDGRRVVRVFSEGLPASILALDDDQIRSAVRRVRLYGMESDSTSRQLARYIAEVAQEHQTTVQPRLIFRPDRFLRGGDHTPFNELGFAAIRFCEMYENYDHQHQNIRTEDGVRYGDLPEFVDAGYLADVTRLNAAVLVHLSNAPSSPSNARVIVADLTNDTTLRWDPLPESDVAGYEIVWRASTSPVWEHAQDVGNETHGTVLLSKDNWLFGVRAYDEDGYRSPVSYPRPARE